MLNAAPPVESKYEILGSNLMTVDSEEPELESTETGIGYNSGTKKDKVQKNSIKLTFSDLGSDSSTAPGSGLDAASVTPLPSRLPATRWSRSLLRATRST